MTTTTSDVTDLLLVSPHDDVAVALHEIPEGHRARTSAGATVPVLGADGGGPVPAGHKVALRRMAAGDLVHKYGQVIGVLTADVELGGHIHSHNLGMPERASREGVEKAAVKPGFAQTRERTFQGIVRADGSVATRNYIGILTSVNCSATVAKLIARQFDGVDLPGIDGVVALTHTSGCGLADEGMGWDILRRTLSGYAQHVNIAGLVVVGLGCEINTVQGLMEHIGQIDKPVVDFTIQELGGSREAIARGAEVVKALADQVGVTQRQPVGLDKLVLGLQCGGSDAWSGMSANPVLGYASDAIVAAGGTSILGETPEVFGAEHLLAARATDPEVAAELLRRIDWWEEYTASHGTTMDGNPSAGNKAGGITTIVEKSLGAVVKAGHAPLSAVVDYAAPLRTGMGLVHMDTPGYDPVSATGMVAGGANLICFTTGRGSVFGSKPAPTIKIATNSTMATAMAGDMDMDCGAVVDGRATIPELGEKLLDLICAVASGEKTFSEELGAGSEEMVPWQIGAVL